MTVEVAHEDVPVNRTEQRPSRLRASSGELKTFSPMSEFRQGKILLVSNEFRYGVKGGRSLEGG